MNKMVRAILNVLRMVGGRKAKIDDNRKLIRVGRDEYKYYEGDHVVVLQIEMLRGKPSRLIYASTIHNWLPPYERDAISEAKRATIAETIRLFLESQGESAAIQ
jgi:hypothetical protein